MDGPPRRQPPKVLVSFHYFRTFDFTRYVEQAGPTVMVMGDSGAYTASSQGKPIAYTDYVAWCRRWGHLFTCYPALDVIGDPATTWHNYQRMRRDELEPVPVYHYGSPLDWLRRYLDAGERLIALGGMVGEHSPDLKAWLVTCFQLAAPYRAAFHGFGRTRMEDLADFPWYSVDSSVVGSACRFGNVYLFDDRSHRMLTLHRWQPRSLYRHGRLMRAHGVTPAQMDNRNRRRDPTKTDTLRSFHVGTIAWRRAEEWIRRRHGPVHGRPGAPPGPHLYLVDASTHHTTTLIQAALDNPGPYLPQPRRGAA